MKVLYLEYYIIIKGVLGGKHWVEVQGFGIWFWWSQYILSWNSDGNLDC